MVGADALQAADRDGLGLTLRRIATVVFLHTPAPACGFARAIAGAPENSGEDVRFPVDEIGVAIASRCYQADVFGDGSMGRASPLAIDDFMEVIGNANIGWLHPLPSAVAAVRRVDRANASCTFSISQARYVCPDSLTIPPWIM